MSEREDNANYILKFYSYEFLKIYFRNDSPLKPIRLYSQSYGLNNIVFEKYLVNRELIK